MVFACVKIKLSKTISSAKFGWNLRIKEIKSIAIIEYKKIKPIV